MYDILYTARTDRFVFYEGTCVADYTSRKSEVDTLNKVTEGRVVYGIVIYENTRSRKRKSIRICVCAHSAPIYTYCDFLIKQLVCQVGVTDITHTLYCP